MLEKAVNEEGTVRVTEKIALRAGSSQQGKALRGVERFMRKRNRVRRSVV